MSLIERAPLDTTSLIESASAVTRKSIWDLVTEGRSASARLRDPVCQAINSDSDGAAT